MLNDAVGPTCGGSCWPGSRPTSTTFSAVDWWSGVTPGPSSENLTVVFQFGPDHDKLLALGGGAWLFGIANPVLYMVILALRRQG